MKPELAKLVAVFQEQLFLPDSTPLLVALACVVANRMEGTPLWILLVGPPGSGKTEILIVFSDEADVYPTAELTVSGLLSGVGGAGRADDATGGVLMEIGQDGNGIILAKDFGTVLSMHNDGRQQVLAALREVYDGRYTRRLGTEGGRTYDWRGKVGFLGGCTAAIDRHHAVMSLMGERFLIFRMPCISSSPDNERELVRRARRNAGGLARIQNTLREETMKFLSRLAAQEATLPEISCAEEDVLYALGSLVARCRSAVERNSYHRDIELVLDPEVPTRVVTQLDRLLAGLLRIGLDHDEAMRTVRKVAFDSMPALKRDLVRYMISSEPGSRAPIARIREAVGQPESTVRRALQDLLVHGVLRAEAGSNSKDEWLLSEWATERLAVLAGFPDLSEVLLRPPADAEHREKPSDPERSRNVS